MGDHVLAYLAGLFDGEGSVVLTSRNKKDKQGVYRKNYVLYSSLSNTDKSVLDLLKNTLGGSLYTHKSASKTGQLKTNYVTHTWVVSNMKAYFAMKVLIPHLRIKREEAEEAIAYIDRNLQKGFEARTSARWKKYDVYHRLKAEIDKDAEETQRRIRHIRDTKRERISHGSTPSQ